MSPLKVVLCCQRCPSDERSLGGGSESVPGTIADVGDGDTVHAQVAGGPALEVQVIGIDAPEPDDCGGEDTTEQMQRLALGRNVTLVSDPTLDQFASPEAGRCSTWTETTV